MKVAYNQHSTTKNEIQNLFKLVDRDLKDAKIKRTIYR